MESWRQRVIESEMSQVYMIVTYLVRVDRRIVYDNDDRQTHRQIQLHLYFLKQLTYSCHLLRNIK